MSLPYLPRRKNPVSIAMEKRNRPKDLISSISLLIVGIIYGGLSLRLPFWSGTGPQEGFFPLTIAAVMIGMSLFILVQSLISNSPLRGKKGSDELEGEVVNRSRVLSYGIWMTLYAAFFEEVGFLVTSTLFLLLMMKYTEKQSWKMTISVGAASILASYLLFVYFLGVPLPKGWMQW